MRVIMIYDQIQAGVGTKDDKMVPLQGKRGVLGPAVMMDPFMREVNGHVIACLYCGTGTFMEKPEEISRKICAMCKKLEADVIICGPCFNYLDYAEMASFLAQYIYENTNIHVLTAMSAEMKDVIDLIKDTVPVVKMPKKGDTGLNESLHNICRLSKSLYEKDNFKEVIEQVCY